MYPEPTNIWQTIQYSPVGIFVAESTWAFPTIETIHVIALVIVFGSIMIMDLRLLGLASKLTPVTKMSDDTLPWTWMAFVLAAITGTLLFVSKAETYMVNPYFLIKLGLLAAAGLNMVYFHFVTYRSVADWDSQTEMPMGAKVAGLLSILLWVAVIFNGRAIGFTLGIYVPDF